MDKKILCQYLESYFSKLKKMSNVDDLSERQERENFYKNYKYNDIINMSKDEFYDYIGKLWAMTIWGNKHYIIDKYINDNGPFKIYYLLEEPELVECTEAQNKVLDEIYNKAHTYKNITNISAESVEVNPTLNIKYLKDVGGAYLSYEQFCLIINNTFSSKYNIKYQVFENIMGKYMIAIIEKKEAKENE